MPTPVTIARQCLAPAAEQALDESVAVAHRRCHSQTTSLHAVSALLSLPSSPLREACTRVRNSAYASRIQFKALELCLGVSLDRLPSTPHRVEEPPISNSFMAAIKRSQANQRRQPENFHLYQQTTSCSTVSMVKVELQNLILSILDDPVVSRVFGESGFRSSEIKLSILRPVHSQPIFLCNLTSNLSFPFLGFLENNEIYKRVNEILVRKNGKNRNNPLLIGPTAVNTVKNFLESLHKPKIGPFSSPEITNVISIQDEILRFVSGNCDVSFLNEKLENIGNVLKENIRTGLVVDFGDLKVLNDGNILDSVEYVVKKLGELLVSYGSRIWLIGYAESNEICMRFFKKFPNVEEDWDLHVLPVNSIKPVMAETFPKSSLMESFVPFGGFFSMPNDIKSPLRISNRFGSLCHFCEEKLRLEVNEVSKGGLNGSVSNHLQSSLPSWLQTAQIRASSEKEVVQAQDVAASAKITGLQKKWHSICQRLHQVEPYLQILPKTTYTHATRVPAVIGFQVAETPTQKPVSSTESSISKSNSGNKKDSPIICSVSGSTTSGNSITTTDLGLRFDQKDFKLVYSSLFTKVGRQEEALGVISETISRCRAEPGAKRGGTWFGFLGPDRAAKKKTAVALAEVLLGGRENVICVDLSCLDFMNRGKNVVDFVADELSKRQLSVVFLENVEMADTLTQHHLSRAASYGRFSDSHGREVSTRNSIFVLTSKHFGTRELEGGKVDYDYTEENILKAKGGNIRLLTGFDLGDVKPNTKPVRVTKNHRTGSPVCKNKRKHYLDLNQPADEESDANYDSTLEDSKTWLEDVLEHVDEKVNFKLFDFDLLAEKILKRISDCFEETIGLDCSLEIDYKLMEQILKSSYFLHLSKTEEWINRVLGEAFVEARRKYGLGSHSVLKLVTADLQEEHVFGDQLPERIIMT